MYGNQALVKEALAMTGIIRRKLICPCGWEVQLYGNSGHKVMAKASTFRKWHRKECQKAKGRLVFRLVAV